MRSTESSARSAGPVHTVVVQPPSRSGEPFYVLLSSGLILLCALYWIGARKALQPERPGAAMLPFQVAFQDLPGPEQRTVRALLEGFNEARNVRSREGRWPTPERLAQDGVPPFAADPIDKSPLRWSLRSLGLLFNYLGAPAQGAGALFLVVIQEPEPVGAETAQPGVIDEEHQLLPDGKLLHVTFWKRDKPDPAQGGLNLVTRPEVEGWTQIRLGRKEDK